MYVHVYARYGWLYQLQDDSEWKQKLAKEKKLTRALKKSIQKLRTELKAVDRVGKPNKPSKKSVSSFKACIS